MPKILNLSVGVMLLSSKTYKDFSLLRIISL